MVIQMEKRVIAEMEIIHDGNTTIIFDCSKIGNEEDTKKLLRLLGITRISRKGGTSSE